MIVEEKANLHETNLQSTKDENLDDQTRAPSNFVWFLNVHLVELDGENRTNLGVDDLYAISQDESNKHILEVDDLSTNLKDGYNNNIIKVVDLYTNHKMKITNMFIKLIIHTQNIK